MMVWQGTGKRKKSGDTMEEEIRKRRPLAYECWITVCAKYSGDYLNILHLATSIFISPACNPGLDLSV